MNDTNNFAADFVAAVWKQMDEDSAQKELEHIREAFEITKRKQNAYEYIEGNRSRRFSAFTQRILTVAIVLFVGACVLALLVG